MYVLYVCFQVARFPRFWFEHFWFWMWHALCGSNFWKPKWWMLFTHEAWPGGFHQLMKLTCRDDRPKCSWVLQVCWDFVCWRESIRSCHLFRSNWTKELERNIVYFCQESHAANTMQSTSKENQDGHVCIISLVVTQMDTIFNMMRSIARP